MDHCERLKRKLHPRERANIFSLLTFAYTGSTFRRAYKNDLEDEDLYEVLTSCGSKKCGDETEHQWILQNKDKSPASISQLLWARFGFRYLFIGIVDLSWKIFNSVVQPYAVSTLVSYFKPGQTNLTKQDAYFYAAVVVSLNILHSVYLHNYIIWVAQLAIEIKTSFSSLLYRKALKLTPSALSTISLGNIVTLITKDVQTFQQSIYMVNDTWIGILHTLTICYLLYAKIGSVCFIGVGIMIGIIPLQVYMGTYVSKLRLNIGKKTDERLQVTQETLSTIRIIKMYTWENFFEKKVNDARIQEITKLLYAVLLRIFIVLTGAIFSRIGFYILVMSYIWLGHTTNTELIFYLLSIFKDLKLTLGIIIPVGMGKAAEVYAAVVRINKVINAEELHPNFDKDDTPLKPFVQMKNATVQIREHTILEDISFKTSNGLTLVTGSVGSGKSSLLKAILQDYPLTGGQLLTHGEISYASQDPWLFPSSIKQNILFGAKYDEKRYNEIIRVCALEYDLSLFDKGDETIVSDRGLNLSKGQQARVNLARAIYKDSEIYLLDDSLTALDAHVQDYIFNECIMKFLKDKICVLVSQTASHIQEADNVIVMDKGQIKSFGNPTENILEVVNQLVSKDDDLEKEVIEEVKEVDDEEQEEHTKLLETEQITKKKVYGEVKKKGRVNSAIYKRYFIMGGGFFLTFLIIAIFGISQAAESYSDKLITKWVDKKQLVLDLEKNFSNLYPEDAILFSENSTFGSYNNYTTKLETAIADEQFTLKFYSAMILIGTMLAVMKIYSLFDFCKRASIKIHKIMSHTIINAVMAFFDTHFIGNILNRFSQDLNCIDEQLPFVLSECFRVTYAMAGIVFLITTVNWRFLIPVTIFLAIMFFLNRFYTPTGRSLKRLEAATRSPMVGHLNASLEGLTTIRAYKAQNILIEEYDRHQDLYTSAHYTLICTMRAYGFVLDFLCSVFIAFVVATFIFVDTDTSAGNVGLVLTQIFMLAANVQWGVRQWAELENMMTSVERILEYTEVQQETKLGYVVQNWPSRGAISYKNVNLTYNNNEKVLKNLCFTVEPKQKIGIVGRTGAGKSSIISTLFRLYDVEGQILIDDVDTKTLSLKFLRTKIAIIPQDPVLFTGSARSNIDPFGEFTDEDLWSVLGKLNVKNLIPSLDFEIVDGGASFSSGQKQLICLARVVIRKQKIVVLDEATANMDHETDILLHNMINDNFSDCTVFIIAHRLHSILECDKVMVLDRGEIREFDDPLVLLEKKGLFHKMVRQAGLLNYIS